MKKLTLLFVAFFVIAASAFAQEKPIYINIAFHKVKPGHTVDEAIAIEKRWKAVHLKRKSLGVITGWAAYKIFNEYKSESVDYDYVSMNASEDLNAITQYPDEMGAVLIKEDPSLYTLVQDSEKVQSVIRNKITKVLEYTGSSNDMNSLVLMEAIQPTTGNNYAYLDFVKKVKSIQVDRIKAGNIQEWALWQHLAPVSSDTPGQYTAVTFFKDLSKLDFNSSQIYINGAKKYMNMTPDQFTKWIAEIRDIKQSVLLKYAVGTFN
jgi:hypothetical protein